MTYRNRTGYRIRLKNTDWYYCPSRTIIAKYSGEKVKSNLSKKGKLYRDYPNVGLCAGKVATHVRLPGFSTQKHVGGYYWRSNKLVGLCLVTTPEDWVVESYEENN